MSKTRKRIEEAKDVNLYKRLLVVLGDFCDKFPMSSVDRLFQHLCDEGAKVLPKDKRALAILKQIVEESVNSLLNKRFSDLPVGLKPMNKSGRRHEIAFWCRDGNVFDRVFHLINFEGSSGKGYWSDVDGKRVKLLDDYDEKTA